MSQSNPTLPPTLNQILSRLITETHDRLINGDSLDLAILPPVDEAKQAILAAIERVIGEDEPLPTHVNDRELTEKSPFLMWCKGRNSLRQSQRANLRRELGLEDDA